MYCLLKKTKDAIEVQMNNKRNLKIFQDEYNKYHLSLSKSLTLFMTCYTVIESFYLSYKTGKNTGEGGPSKI